MSSHSRPFKDYWYNLVFRNLLNAVYDARRFLRACNSHQTIADMSREEADGHMLRTMHSLEKGLAMPAPTPDFGTAKALKLKADADAYALKYGRNRIHDLALSVLASFSRYRQANQTPIEELQNADVSDAAGRQQAGVRELSRDEIWQAARIDFPAFALSRSSVRMFDDRPVSKADLLEAIRVAQKSPSVCNRSCARVYMATDPAVISQMLEHQGGAKGFGNRAGALLMIAADMSAFYKSGERYQGWIDGGLFAMSLNYALHAKGYGICMLNWSKDGREDARFRKAFAIPDAHLLVMMMAVGHLPERLRVAVSPRPELEDVVWSLDTGAPEKAC